LQQFLWYKTDMDINLYRKNCFKVARPTVPYVFDIDLNLR